MFKATLRSLSITLCSILLYSTTYGQIFIPNLTLRDSLNAQIPGIVDAAGMLNELDPGIAMIETLNLDIQGTEPILDLTGLDHLVMLRSISVLVLDTALDVVEEVRIPAFPDATEYLTVVAHSAELFHIGQLPDSMLGVYVYRENWNPMDSVTTMQFDGLPNYVEVLGMGDAISYTWPGTVHCREFHLGDISGNPGSNSVVVPPVMANELRLSIAYVDSLDISQISVPRIIIDFNPNYDWISWPMGVEHITVGAASGSYDVGYPYFRSLPENLDSLTCLTYVACLPALPNSISNLTGDIYCVPNWPTSLQSASFGGSIVDESTVTYCSVLNSDCPGPGASISGRVVMDLNTNGIADTGEPRVLGMAIQIAPPYQASAGCDASGHWEIGVPTGNHVISAPLQYPYAISIAPLQYDVEVLALGELHPNNDFAVTVMPNIQDLVAVCHTSFVPPRPGFDNRVTLTIQNYGTEATDAVLSFTFDALQTWVSSSISPTIQVGTMATWNFPGLSPSEIRQVDVDLNTGVGVALSTLLNYTTTAEPVATDETQANNQHTTTANVVGSYDPNDKSASPNVLSPAQVQAGETPIEYTIRFQNTGTYLAERVVILDTLSEDLQWESMRFIASSHPKHWYVTDGVLHVIHNDILLPDSTTNEVGSHGFIKFSMLPATDLQDGATISNIAHIVFDFNEPIITPPAVFTVDVLAGVHTQATEQMHVYPNPATDLLRVELPSGNFQGMNYVVRGVLGQVVTRGRLNGSKQVPISGLEDGSYTIELIGAETRSVARFVKQ